MMYPNNNFVCFFTTAASCVYVYRRHFENVIYRTSVLKKIAQNLTKNALYVSFYTVLVKLNMLIERFK